MRFVLPVLAVAALVLAGCTTPGDIQDAYEQQQEFEHEQPSEACDRSSFRHQDIRSATLTCTGLKGGDKMTLDLGPCTTPEDSEQPMSGIATGSITAGSVHVVVTAGGETLFEDTFDANDGDYYADFYSEDVHAEYEASSEPSSDFHGDMNLVIYCSA